MTDGVRCAFCHDDLVDGGTGPDERVECKSCRTVLHWDCRALLTKCPTLGCFDATFTRGGRVATMRPAFREALARLSKNAEHIDVDAIDPKVRVQFSTENVCQVCWRPMLLVWSCSRCGTRAHFTCRYLVARRCPREDCGVEVARTPVADEARTAEAKKRALDSLKKRPPRA